jgi:hypothetical protein
MYGQTHFLTEHRYMISMLNNLNHSGVYMYHLLQNYSTSHFVHKVYLWVLYDSQIKERLCP